MQIYAGVPAVSPDYVLISFFKSSMNLPNILTLSLSSTGRAARAPSIGQVFKEINCPNTGKFLISGFARAGEKENLREKNTLRAQEMRTEDDIRVFKKSKLRN